MSMVRMIVGGVDTHADSHVAAVIDANGGILGVESFPTDESGFEALVGWLTSYGEIQVVGVEGTGSWGVGLARFLHDHEIPVVEVDRQNRQNRRRVGKSDSTDAISAARAALSGSALVIPKTRNGPVEQIRILMVARRSARSQRIETLNQLRHLIFTSPEEIRSRFKDRPKTGLVTDVAKLRPRKGSDPVTYTTMVTMRGLARRIQHLNSEIKALTACSPNSSSTRHRRWLISTESGPTPQQPCWWLQETTQTGSTASGHGHICVASAQSPRVQAKRTAGTG